MEPIDVNAKDARFDTRLSKEQKQLFERAAVLGGFRNLTDFVVYTVNEKAKSIVAENERFLYSNQDNVIFFDAVLNPPKPNNDLLKATEEFKNKLNP
jgi:uncharacterized protein (DUF1778 family)